MMALRISVLNKCLTLIWENQPDPVQTFPQMPSTLARAGRKAFTKAHANVKGISRYVENSFFTGLDN